MRIIADTNFLMLPGTLGVDIMRELERLVERRFELLVPSPVIKELEQISTHGSPKERTAARIGLSLARHGAVVRMRGDADDCIVRLAAKKGYVVGTTDSELRRRLRRLGVSVIYLRKRSHLVVDGHIG